jgi:molybdopterin molybdotransferase
VKPRIEAQREVLAAVPSLGTERVPLASALGRVLAEPVVAAHDVPPFANSAMDGYAIRAADLASVPVTLDVIEDVPAGSVPAREVTPGTAIRIMTGAPMPFGADTVVEVEVTETTGNEVTISAAREAGTHVRPAGGDVPRGVRVLEPGERLNPAMLGVLASLGVVEPAVGRRPVVAIITTGDELLPPDAPVPPKGKIRDSNRTTLSAMLTGIAERVIDFGILGDQADPLRAAIREAARDADVVITSGGVSMGEYDVVKAVLTELGGVEFWKVAQQPGKPFAFGQVAGTPLFGLPGNPVSVMVSFEQFVRPALLHMTGATALFRPHVRARLAEGISTNPEKDVFLRVRVNEDAGELRAVLSGGQSSNVLSAMATADGFALVPVGVGDLAAGDLVVLEMFSWPESRTREAIDA